MVLHTCTLVTNEAENVLRRRPHSAISLYPRMQRVAVTPPPSHAPRMCGRRSDACVEAVLTLCARMLITGRRVNSQDGGAINNQGAMKLHTCTLERNEALQVPRRRPDRATRLRPVCSAWPFTPFPRSPPHVPPSRRRLCGGRADPLRWCVA